MNKFPNPDQYKPKKPATPETWECAKCGCRHDKIGLCACLKPGFKMKNNFPICHDCDDRAKAMKGGGPKRSGRKALRLTHDLSLAEAATAY